MSLFKNILWRKGLIRTVRRAQTSPLLFFGKKSLVSKMLESQCHNQFYNLNLYLSHEVGSESEITPCIKINKPLVVVYIFNNVM